MFLAHHQRRGCCARFVHPDSARGAACLGVQMFNMMLSGWARCTVATTPLPAAVCWEKIGSLYRIFTSLITLPEYTYEAHPVPPAGFVEGMCQRLSASNHAEEQVIGVEQPCSTRLGARERSETCPACHISGALLSTC